MSRRWKILIIVAAVVVLAAGSAFVSLHVQPGNEVEAYKKLLRAKGEKLELAEVLPPPAAPAENGADAFLDAAGLFSSAVDNYAVMQMVGPGRAAVCWQLPDVRGYDFTNSWDQFQAYVDGDRPAVGLLHQILDHPKLDFNLDYSQGARMPVTHLATMKRAAQKLTAAVELDLHDGDTGAATTNLLTMLAMVQRDWRDDMLIGHLVRVAILAITVAPTWEFLQATNATDAQLAALQNAWQQFHALKDAENSLTLERTWLSREMAKYRASHESFQELSGNIRTMSASMSGGPSGWESVTEAPRYAVAEMMWRSSWSYTQELQALQRNQVVLEAVRAMQTNRSQFYKADYDAMSARLSAIGGTNLSSPVLRALNIPDFHDIFFTGSLGGIGRKTLTAETEERVVATAIALKRFQLKHGKFPETLVELTPDYLPSITIDPYDGKPLKYHSSDDGTYLLYSVGEDGIDDGGDAGTPSGKAASWAWMRSRDWVWPQPATPAEVQFYLEHPPVK
jgi:hypothetical protein